MTQSPPVAPSPQTTARASYHITLRVALGFTAITLLLLNAAQWLGLVPDRTYNVLEERTFVAESLAVTYAGLAQVGSLPQIRPMLETIVHRAPGVAHTRRLLTDATSMGCVAGIGLWASVPRSVGEGPEASGPAPASPLSS